jgi:glycosyltransferase involved in cell wall biosynthesis
MNDILLSICIPTFNRARFLNRSLFYLTSQIESIVNSIEIIVIDNDSDDETYSVVQKYIETGCQISYIKNDYNLGADVNVDKCYQIARGKYVLVLGDDDLIVLNTLNKLINILDKSDYGVIHLTAKPIESDLIYELNKENLNFKTFNNSNDFFYKIGYNITFISANIVNKKYYNSVITSNYLGSSLPQVPLIVHSIINAKSNLLITDAIVRAQVDNSGGYNLLKVFGVNFNNILLDIGLKYPETRVHQIITNKMLSYFLPFWIVKLKKDANFDKSKKSNILFMPLYKSNFRFWIYCYPLEFMPYKIAFLYNYIIHIPHKTKKVIYNCFMN